MLNFRVLGRARFAAAAALTILAASLAAPASAAFLRLDPMAASGLGPVEFTVFLEGHGGPVRDADIELRFVDEGSVVSLGASDVGNQFAAAPFAGFSRISATCTDGALSCWQGGGSTLGPPGISTDPINLGTLTLSANGPVSIVVSSGSRWTDSSLVSHAVEGIGTTVATLPEPQALAMIALLLFALAVLGRAGSRDARR